LLEDEAAMRVRDVMTYGALGVPVTATLSEAVETMLRSHVSALFVFDAEHAMVGVVSEGDLLRRAELGTERKRPHWLEFLLSGGRLAQSYAHSHGRKVAEIMTPEVVTIAEDADLSEAVDLMLKRKVKRLPVLRGEAVVGVISRSDLLKGLLESLPKPDAPHPDAEIKAAIQVELDKLGWAPRASVRVEVANGVVTFEGAITDERLRSGLKVIAENTPGVKEVHDHIGWIEPNSGFYLPTEEEDRS
jgi:CBS domain-containing protein